MAIAVQCINPEWEQSQRWDRFDKVTWWLVDMYPDYNLFTANTDAPWEWKDPWDVVFKDEEADVAAMCILKFKVTNTTPYTGEL